MTDLPRSLVTLTETSFVVALWNISFHGAGDWMAVVYRDAPGAAWRAMYRFRWYVDEQAWDSQDSRHAVHVHAKDGSDAARDLLVSTVDHIAGELAAAHRSTVEKIPIAGDAEAFSAVVRSLPWFHTRTTTIEPDE